MKAEEEYRLALKYLDELKKVYDDKGQLVQNKTNDVPVISIWTDLIEKAIEETGKRDEIYTIVARDFQRFFSCFLQYSGIINKMYFSETEEYKVLIRKIVDLDFFENTFKEDSNNFYKLREWSKTLRNKELMRKINSHLDCIIVGLFRQLKKRYGTAK